MIRREGPSENCLEQNFVWLIDDGVMKASLSRDLAPRYQMRACFGAGTRLVVTLNWSPSDDSDSNLSGTDGWGP